MESSSAVKKHVKSARHRNARNFFAGLSKSGRRTETSETKGEEEESEISVVLKPLFPMRAVRRPNPLREREQLKKKSQKSDVVDVELVTREKTKKEISKEKIHQNK